MATKKKTAAKKTTKKAPARKAAATATKKKKKVAKVAKKAAPRKAAAKKAPKKAAAKKATAKAVNTRARRPAAETAKPEKKLPPSKAQKAAALLAAKKAAALKKADRKPKKSDRKKPAPKTPAQRKVAAGPKKAAPKKAAPQKAAPKKAARDDGDTFHEVILTGEVVALPGKAAKKANAGADGAPPKATKAAQKQVERGDPAHDLAQLCAAVALEKKAEDVVILEVTQLTTYADCFVVCGAPSERQVQGIARALEDEMKKIGRRAVSTEGLEQGHWVLVDFGAVVVHIFVQNARQYYDLEGFWTDAPRIDVDEKRGIALGKLLQEEFNQAQAEAHEAESQSA